MSDKESEVQPSEAAAPEATGLLDGVETSDESQPDSSKADKSEVDHRATENIPDDEPVDRPEWWPENFWKDNEPDLEGIAKSWKDMRKMVSQGKQKAPADGNYDTKAFGENADNLPMVPLFKEWAKENGISQVAFDSLAKQLTDKAAEVTASMAGSNVDPAAERKALGANAEAVINGMVSWARGLVNKGVWNKDDFEEFKVMGGTAKGLKALMKIRESYEGRIPVESEPMEGMPTDQELQAMVGDKRYQTDPGYRQKVERLFSQRYN